MNERIKQLAHEAGLPTYNPEGIPTKLEKFAELIVEECVQVVKDSHRFGNPMAKTVVRDASNAVRKHFGVKR